MQRLILFRHGDARRDSESGDDFDRRLSTEGREETARVAAALADMGLAPDIALVSAAVRTRETWSVLSEAFPKARARFEDELYLAEPDRVRQAAEKAGEDCGALMVVGHNPGLQELALALLIENGAATSQIGKVQSRFPTGSAAVFLIDANGRATLDGLFYPKDLR